MPSEVRLLAAMAEHLLSVGENMALARESLRRLNTAETTVSVEFHLLEARRALNKASKQLGSVAYWVGESAELPKPKIVTLGEE